MKELTGHCEVVMGLQKELVECKREHGCKTGKKCMPCLWNLQSKRCRILHVLRYGTSGEEEEKEEEWFTRGPVETEEQEEKEREKKAKSRKQKLKKKPKEPWEETKEETAPEQDAGAGKYGMPAHRRRTAMKSEEKLDQCYEAVKDQLPFVPKLALILDLVLVIMQTM